MSADSWAICPQCKAIAEKANKKSIENAEKSYGKVSSEKYLEMMAAANEPTAVANSLREDYEIRMDDDGEFTISYGCSCQRCKFTFEYNHSERPSLKITK